jgi:hypothetical protein
MHRQVFAFVRWYQYRLMSVVEVLIRSKSLIFMEQDLADNPPEANQLLCRLIILAR